MSTDAETLCDNSEITHVQLTQYIDGVLRYQPVSTRLLRLPANKKFKLSFSIRNNNNIDLEYKLRFRRISHQMELTLGNASNAERTSYREQTKLTLKNSSSHVIQYFVTTGAGVSRWMNVTTSYTVIGPMSKEMRLPIRLMIVVPTIVPRSRKKSKKKSKAKKKTKKRKRK